MLRLKCTNLVRVRKRQSDIIQPVEDAMFAERINIELEAFTRGRVHRLLFQINREAVAFAGGCFLEQLIDNFSRPT